MLEGVEFACHDLSPVQGHYARDQEEVAKYPADITIERVGLLVDCDLISPV